MQASGPVILIFEWAQETPGGSLNMQIPWPIPRESASDTAFLINLHENLEKHATFFYLAPLFSRR